MAVDPARQPVLHGCELSRSGQKTAGADADLGTLERALGHTFAERELLQRAVLHSSAATRGDRGNERMEFLGDRVLGLVIAEDLIARFGKETEGDLAKRLAHLVKRDTLAPIAEALDLGQYLSLAKGDDEQDNRRNPNILSDALEAVIAALYLDAGLDAARRFILAHWRPLLEGAAAAAPPRDAKTSLQEWALARALPLPDYRVVRQEGPPHDPRFVVEVSVTRLPPRQGSGRSKREAEHKAAAALLADIQAGAKR